MSESMVLRQVCRTAPRISVQYESINTEFLSQFGIILRAASLSKKKKAPCMDHRLQKVACAIYI